MSDITFLRDTLAAEMIALLNDAEFNGKSISEHKQRELSEEAEGLLFIVHSIDSDK